MSKSALNKYKSIDNLKREIKIQRKLDHPHVTKLFSCFEDSENVYLILEYCPRGSLFQNLRKKNFFSEDETFVYFFQTCLGIDYIHKKKYIHRDLKPENLLLDKFGNVKICDFGWSTEFNKAQKGFLCGTIEYMPPEMIRNESHDQRLDIWGLGILLYVKTQLMIYPFFFLKNQELLHGKPPFTGRNDQQKCVAILNSSNFQGLQFNTDLSSDVVDLIKSILKHQPNARPTIRGIFQHKWMLEMQKKHRINLLDYLWEDLNIGDPNIAQSPPTQEFVQLKAKAIQQQQQQYDNQFQQDKEFDLRSLRRLEQSNTQVFLTQTYTNTNRYQTNYNPSTHNLLAQHAKKQDSTKNLQTQQTKPTQNIRNTTPEVRWNNNQKDQDLNDVFTPKNSKKTKNKEIQRTQSVGFLKQLFITLGCINREKPRDY